MLGYWHASVNGKRYWFWPAMQPLHRRSRSPESNDLQSLSVSRPTNPSPKPKLTYHNSRARYCSKACQKDAWKHHKNMCKSVAETLAEIYPDNVPDYKVLNAALNKWMQCWTFALNRWVCAGMNLPNHPPDRASTHWYESQYLWLMYSLKYHCSCVVCLKRRPNPPTPAQAFVVIVHFSECVLFDHWLL